MCQASVLDGTRFEALDLHSECRLDGARFGNDIQFVNSRFRGKVAFDGATFGESAVFENARFNKEASFRDVDLWYEITFGAGFECRILRG